MPAVANTSAIVAATRHQLETSILCAILASWASRCSRSQRLRTSFAPHETCLPPTQIFFGWHFCFRVVFYSEVSFAMHVRAFSIVDAVIAMSMGRGIQLLAHVNIAKLCQATAEGIFRQNSILPASCALQASPAWSMV